MRAFPIKLPSCGRYWTVVDDDYRVVTSADGYLRHLRLGQDAAESTTKAYAEGAGAALVPVVGLGSTTAAGLARRMRPRQWAAVETGVATVTARMLERLPAQRPAALLKTVTIDLDTTDGEVYGRHKRGVAYNYQGQRCGWAHVASWAELEVSLAADLMAGDQDPRPSAPGLLRRALRRLPGGVGEVTMRADGGYFAVDLAVAAHREGVGFAIGAKRIAPLWAALAGISERTGGRRSTCPAPNSPSHTTAPPGGPPAPSCSPRRVALAPEQISTDPRARRRRTLHPDQRALPFDELANAEAVYGYSFILTNLDVATPAQAAAVEQWYRHRTTIENIFRDSKHGAALRHLPSGYAEVNTAWMWGALLAVSMAGWLHQLTATPTPEGRLRGWGAREGKAMIATLRHRLIRIPARLIRHAGQTLLRLPPGHQLLAEVLTRLRALPAAS